MTQLTVQSLVISAASLGGENPLAPLRAYETASAAGAEAGNQDASILPYRLQDQYDGTPVLRLYEWERVRCVPFQIDCWLPDDSPFLMVRVRIINPNDHAIPMYWWSNIAVPEHADVRVLGPADKAYRHDYDGTLVGH